jgi:CHASE3 domain sensor protein
MSYPYPQDRHRDRKEKGEQPYKDAREAMSQQEANLQAEAEGYGEAHHQESDEERMARLEQEAADRLAKVGEEVNKERDA